MNSPFFRRFLSLYPAIIIAIGILWGTLWASIDAFAFKHFYIAQSEVASILVYIGTFYALFCIAAFIAAVILLFRGKEFHAFCCFVAAYTFFASIFLSSAFQGDKFVFTSAPHREIAEIYNGHKLEWGPADSRAHLVALNGECHPPNGCECWVVLDPGHASGVQKEMGGWHRPTAPIFPMHTLPQHFAIVNVRRLGPDDYSVLGCEVDRTALVP